MKLDPSVFSGNGSGGLAVSTAPTDVNVGECVIRRSARNRRPRGELRIVVSSSDKLSDLKIKVNIHTYNVRLTTHERYFTA